jgi:hypothetical protein
MVVLNRDGQWEPQEVYQWPPYCVCDWVTLAVVLARRVPDKPSSPPVDPYTQSAELMALVSKHYDTAESLACKRPMFKDGLGTVVLEMFARQHSVKPAEVERVLESLGLPAQPSPGWAERVVDELGRLFFFGKCPSCGGAEPGRSYIRVDSSIVDRPHYVCGSCHHRWPARERP